MSTQCDGGCTVMQHLAGVNLSLSAVAELEALVLHETGLMLVYHVYSLYKAGSCPLHWILMQGCVVLFSALIIASLLVSRIGVIGITFICCVGPGCTSQAGPKLCD